MSAVLAGKVALVTGASRGIGRAVALEFAREGADVICVARSKGALEDLDDEIISLGGKAVLVPEDLTTPGLVDKIAGAIRQRYGRLDILVGNAATLGGELTPVGDPGPERLHSILALNVTANWALIHHLQPLMRASAAPRAIFVTDSTARKAEPYWGAYGASKAALETLVRTWAAEIAVVSTIKVNLIDPGPVATRLRAQAFPGENPALLTQPGTIAPAFVTMANDAWNSHGETIMAQTILN